MIGQSLFADGHQRSHRSLVIVAAAGPVDVQQVHAIDTQPIQARSRPGLDLPGLEGIHPQFRRQRHIIAVDVAPGQTVAHDALVLVYLCGVEVTIPDI